MVKEYYMYSFLDYRYFEEGGRTTMIPETKEAPDQPWAHEHPGLAERFEAIEERLEWLGREMVRGDSLSNIKNGA
jgi:hypothetical protein